MKSFVKNYLYIILLCCLFYYTDNLIWIILNIFISGILLFIDKDFDKLIKRLFVIYISGLVYYTLYKFGLSRSFIGSEWNIEIFKHYLKNEVNIIPFRSITKFINLIISFKENITLMEIITNIIGNFICLIPLSFFIPYFWQKLRRPLNFLLTVICLSLGIEIIQFLTMLGSFDIDDIILNSSGAFLLYLLFKNEIIYFYDNNLSLVKGKKARKKLLLKIIIIVVLLISTGILIYYLLQREENYYIYSITQTTYPDICKTREWTLIDEDIYNKYEIDCSNYKDIEIEINKKTYRLADYLNDKVPHIKNIDKLTEASINIKTTNKVKTIELCFAKSYEPYRPDVEIDIENNDIVTSAGYSQDKGAYCYEYQFTPLNTGETIIKINLKDEVKKYSAVVDSEKVLTITPLES